MLMRLATIAVYAMVTLAIYIMYEVASLDSVTEIVVLGVAAGLLFALATFNLSVLRSALRKRGLRE